MRALFWTIVLILLLIVVLFVWEMVAYDKNKHWSLVCRDYSFNKWVQAETSKMCAGMSNFNKTLRSKYLGSE